MEFVSSLNDVLLRSKHKPQEGLEPAPPPDCAGIFYAITPPMLFDWTQHIDLAGPISLHPYIYPDAPAADQISGPQEVRIRVLPGATVFIATRHRSTLAVFPYHPLICPRCQRITILSSTLTGSSNIGNSVTNRCWNWSWNCFQRICCISDLCVVHLYNP